MCPMPVPPPRDPVPAATAGTVRVNTTALATVVAATGDLDLLVAGRLAAVLDHELVRRPRMLVFDASAVTFCGARAMTVLLDTATAGCAADVPFAIAGRRRSMLRPITVLGLQQLLPVHRSTAEALDWLRLLPQLTELSFGQCPQS